MEPKNPIVIDGVDISGCDELVNGYDCYLTEEHNYRSETPYTYDKCSGFPNCYFKQLKRKEKENERYEQTLIIIEDIAKAQIPHLNIDESKTMTEIEYDYAGKIYVLEQRMNKILQNISEVLDE